MKTILTFILITITISLNAKGQEKKDLYLLFDKAAGNDLEKSFYVKSITISKSPRKYKKTIEDVYLYTLDSSFEFPLKFITKNKCSYYLTDFKTLKDKDLKPLKWIKESKIIKDGYDNALPFQHIYICEKFGPDTYLVTEVDLWIGSN